MRPRRFFINCIFRVLLLAATLLLAVYLFSNTEFLAAAVFISLVGAYQVFALMRFVSRTNRDLTRLLDSIQYADFSQSFTGGLEGAGFEELNTALNNVIDKFRQAKLEKEEHFRFLQTIIDHVGIGLVAFNPDGAVELINTAAKRLMGITYLRNIADLKSVSPVLEEKLRRVNPGENHLIKLQQGENLMQLSVYATGFVLRRKQMLLVAMQNIQNELEEKEMMSWQNLIRVLTHEIMNSIAPIASLASTANGLLTDECQLEGNDPRAEKFQDVCDAVETIEKRSKGLITFIEKYRELTRIPQPQFQVLPAADLFDRIQFLMKDQFENRSISFSARIDPQTLSLTADPALMEQVLINLCKNAAESVDGRANAEIKLLARMDTSGNAVIEVVDNGKGIHEDVADRIFIPFFTTKPKGSGIGLSLSRQIMRLHKGTITVSSTPGGETTFKLKF
jgi:nitrogen fixation/metabolism regulation signal transduction histidine kinase